MPLLPGVADLVAQGCKTGGSARNWSSYGASVELGERGDLEQTVLNDPQTSGGLLVACAPDAVDPVLDAFRTGGFEGATVIGEIADGHSVVTVR